jgi:hypothetical protein
MASRASRQVAALAPPPTTQQTSALRSQHHPHKRRRLQCSDSMDSVPRSTISNPDNVRCHGPDPISFFDLVFSRDKLRCRSTTEAFTQVVLVAGQNSRKIILVGMLTVSRHCSIVLSATRINLAMLYLNPVNPQTE